MSTLKKSNRVFDFSRFGKVFMYDLDKSWQNYGLTFVILVLLPLIFPFIYAMASVVFGEGWNVPGDVVRIAIALLGITILLFTHTPNVFGKITGKQYGSEFLMVPASTFEKFLSMALVSAIVTPLAFVLCYFATDAIAVATGLSEGRVLIAHVIDNMVISEDGLRMNIVAILSISYMLNCLIFLLGSVYFNRFKIGKTLLVLFVIEVVFTFISIPVFSHIINSPDFLTINGEDVILWLEQHVDNLNLYINLFMDSVYIIEYAVVLSLLYLRLRTMKH